MNHGLIILRARTVSLHRKNGFMIASNGKKKRTGVSYALSVICESECVTSKAMAYMTIRNTVTRECAETIRTFLDDPAYIINPFFRGLLVQTMNDLSFERNRIYRSYTQQDLYQNAVTV